MLDREPSHIPTFIRGSGCFPAPRGAQHLGARTPPPAAAGAAPSHRTGRLSPPQETGGEEGRASPSCQIFMCIAALSVCEPLLLLHLAANFFCQASRRPPLPKDHQGWASGGKLSAQMDQGGNFVVPLSSASRLQRHPPSGAPR